MGYPIALPDPLTPASRGLFGLAGLATTGISGDLTLTKLGIVARTATFPDYDIEVQPTAEVVSSSWQARKHAAYTAIATGTATDPGTPAAGHEFTTLVRNGTITIGGTAYSSAGLLVRRVWHSGSWTNYQYPHLDGAWTWSAAQKFNVDVGIAVTAVASGGSLQLGTGSGSGIGFQSGGVVDTRVYRSAASTAKTDGAFIVGGTSSTALQVDGGIFMNRAAGVDAQMLLQVSGTGSIQFGFNKSGSTNATGAADGEMYFGSNGALPFSLTTSGTRRFRIDGSGNYHLRGGTPVTPSAFTAWTGTATRTTIATGSATATNCAEAIKALIDDLKSIGVLP
jgi:hypothetical protein